MLNSFVKVNNRNVNAEFNLDHETLLAIIENPKIVANKEDAELFYAFKMKSYPNIRDTNEVIAFDTLILDFDGSSDSMRTILERFAKYKYYFYTSFNHKIDKNTGGKSNVEKFRIILPLDKEYPATWFKAGIMKAVFNSCKIFKDADQACAKITQYYVPCTTAERLVNYRFRFNEGENFSLNPFYKIAEEVVKSNTKQIMKRNIIKKDSDNEEYINNLMNKYKKIVTQRCSERGTGVHAAMCRVNAGLAKAKCDYGRRYAFMVELFLPTNMDERKEIECICKGFGG